MTRIWIGTSGYSYTDWVGRFYPSGTRSGAMLAFYSREFPLVELNFTFYRMPTAEGLLRMAEQPPGGFQFSRRRPGSRSPERGAGDPPPFRDAVTALHERGRLLGLLGQFPQSTANTETNRRWVERLGRSLEGLSLAIEFRHRSWDQPGTLAWLRSLDLTLVSVDVPDLPGLFPRGV